MKESIKKKIINSAFLLVVFLTSFQAYGVRMHLYLDASQTDTHVAVPTSDWSLTVNGNELYGFFRKSSGTYKKSSDKSKISERTHVCIQYDYLKPENKRRSDVCNDRCLSDGKDKGIPVYSWGKCVDGNPYDNFEVVYCQCQKIVNDPGRITYGHISNTLPSSKLNVGTNTFELGPWSVQDYDSMEGKVSIKLEIEYDGQYKHVSGGRKIVCDSTIYGNSSQGYGDCQGSFRLSLKEVSPSLHNELKTAEKDLEHNKQLYKNAVKDYEGIDELYKAFTNIKDKNFDEITEADLQNVKWALKLYEDFKNSINKIQNDISENIQKIENSIQDTKKVLLSGLEEEGYDITEDDQYDVGEVSDLDPIEIPPPKDASDPFDQENNFYDNWANSVIRDLNFHYAANDRVGVLVVAYKWVEKNELLLPIVQRRSSVSSNEFKAYQESVKKVEQFLYGDGTDEHKGIVTRKFWFKDLPYPEALKNLLDENIDESYVSIVKSKINNWTLTDGQLDPKQRNYLLGLSAIVHGLKQLSLYLKEINEELRVSGNFPPRRESPEAKMLKEMQENLQKTKEEAVKFAENGLEAYIEGTPIGPFIKMCEAFSGKRFCDFNRPDMDMDLRLNRAAEGGFWLFGPIAKLATRVVSPIIVGGKKIFGSTFTWFSQKVKKILGSAKGYGVKTSGGIKVFVQKNTYKILARISDKGYIHDGVGYRLFNKIAGVSNPFPQNATFARVVPREYFDAIKRGEATLSGPARIRETGEAVNEVFITALDDIGDLTSSSKIAERLSLYNDEAGTQLRDLSNYVVMKFKFKETVATSIRSPLETDKSLRLYGFINGGRTKGGAREWLINNDAVKTGIIDLNSIEKVKELN